MNIFTQNDIRNVIDLDQHLPELMATQRQAFIDFSRGLFTVPLPMQLAFHDESNHPHKHSIGDCHVKGGYAKDGDMFIIKVATGFHTNAAKGLPPGDGLMILFDQKAGLIKALFQDKAYLTHLRTALAVCVAAQITPFPIHTIGIVGTGTQGTLCLDLLSRLYPAARFFIWGRDEAKAKALATQNPRAVASSLAELTAHSDIIITTTPSHEPLLYPNHMLKNVHIISVGADGAGKQELAPELFSMADKIIVDSRAQTARFGDTSYALQAGHCNADDIIELGEALLQPQTGSLLITDLTGIAAQDLTIAGWVYEQLS